MRKVLFCLLAALLLPMSCFAEAYTAHIEALYTETVEADTAFVEPGQTVAADDIVGLRRVTKAFAPEDGTVSIIGYDEGDTVSGTVLEIMPVEKYNIYCKTDGALVSAGQTVYVKCTKNGTHRGLGYVVKPDGNEFHVLTIGGEFYVGEAVNLYADAGFEEKIGIGTVVINDTVVCEGTGTLVRLSVQPGEYVERGELLFETASADSVEVKAGFDGIAVSAAGGVIEIAPREALYAVMTVGEEEAAKFVSGQTVTLVYPFSEEDEGVPGTVVSVFGIDGSYTVRIRPDDVSKLRIGLTAEVFTK